MSVEEIALALGRDPSTVRYYISQGQLSAKKYGRSYTVSVDALKTFFETEFAEGENWAEFLDFRLSQEENEQGREILKGLINRL